MKKIGIIAFAFLISTYSIYYDLKIGTLPTTQVVASSVEPTKEIEEEAQETPTYQIPAELIVVEPGYTVLSVVEELHGEPVKASIQQIVIDFETLNPGTSASNIQVGKAYLFPVYFK